MASINKDISEAIVSESGVQSAMVDVYTPGATAGIMVEFV